MASTILTRTPTVAGNRKTWTWSGWVKRASTSGNQCLMTQVDAWSGNSNAGFYLISGSLTSYNFTSALNSGGSSYNRPSLKLRDINGWYHIVVRLDTTQSTASDRLRWYVNGTQQTDFDYSNYPSLNQDCNFNNTSAHGIGGHTTGGSFYFDGSMAHVHFCDGQSYAPTEFAETDSTSGIWKPKTAPSVTYGTNGFFLKFQDSSSLGDDSSGNTNDFTLSGSGIQILDTPSNVFATLNPLDKGYTGTMGTSDGNTTMDSASGSGDYGMRSTLAVKSGKWYWETKLPNYGGGAGGNTMMVMDASIRLQDNMQGGSPRAGSWGIQRYDDTKTNLFEDGTFISQNTAMWGGFTTSDIIGIALDCDNGKIYFSKNGVFKDRNGNTGDPANGTNPTFTGLDTTEFYTFYTENRANLDNGTSVNFGNGYFQTTAVSSAQNDGAGYGKFEYTPPTGFYALCTKNINTYG